MKLAFVDEVAAFNPMDLIARNEKVKPWWCKSDYCIYYYYYHQLIIKIKLVNMLDMSWMRTTKNIKMKKNENFL